MNLEEALKEALEANKVLRKEIEALKRRIQFFERSDIKFIRTASCTHFGLTFK